MIPTKDNRAIVHVAGPIDALEQHCVRCRALVSGRQPWVSYWREGAAIANHSHGDWSVVHEPVDRTKYRICKFR